MAPVAIQPPEWLSQDFVQSALREGTKDKGLTITRYTIVPATNPGDNYVSQIFRVTIETENAKKTSFLVKSLPLGAMENFVHDQKFFEKETKMLTETLPVMQRHLRRAGCGHQFFANVLYCQGPPKNLIFLEDLKAAGYANANRQAGLDLDHTKMVLESLALLHASSLAVLEEEPYAIKYYDRSFWVESNEALLTKPVKDGVVALADELEKWGNVFAKYSQKLKNLETTILNRSCNSCRRNDKKFNVLLHGDTWTNNFMFKYDAGGKLHSLKFVDFQLSNYNCPALDLIYLVFSSTHESIKLRHLDLFLEIYHKKLVETCNKLNIASMNYSLQDLKDDFKERLFFGFVVTLCIFPFTIAPTSEAVDVNEMLDHSKEFSTSHFKSERFRKSLEMVLPYFEENGVI